MEKTNLTYRQNGDYLIPNLSLPKENIRYKNKTIGNTFMMLLYHKT